MTDSDERIRQRAHDLWEAAGRPEGHAHEHWEKAKAEIAGESDSAVLVAGDHAPTGTEAKQPPATKGRPRKTVLEE